MPNPKLIIFFVLSMESMGKGYMKLLLQEKYSVFPGVIYRVQVVLQAPTFRVSVGFDTG